MRSLKLALGSKQNCCTASPSLHYFHNSKCNRFHVTVCHAKDQKSLDGAKKTVSPSPNTDKSDAREQKPSFIISDWRAADFWSQITWNGALPATFAIAIQYIQTSTFVKVTMPSIEFAPDMLFWALPTMALDFTIQGPICTLLNKNVHPQSPHTMQQIQKGIQSYVLEAKRVSKQERRHMPPVQRLSARLLVCAAQQLALQGVVTTALMALLFEIKSSNPNVLPVLLSVPGTSTVDGAFVGSVALLAAPLAMSATRIKQAEAAFQDDHLERRTAQFVQNPDAAGLPMRSSVVDIMDFLSTRLLDCEVHTATPGPHNRGLSQAAVHASLTGCRLSLLTSSCCMIYMQTGSVLAATWVMFVCANFRDRMSQ